MNLGERVTVLGVQSTLCPYRVETYTEYCCLPLTHIQATCKVVLWCSPNPGLLHYARGCAENLTEASALVPICRIVSYVIFRGGESRRCSVYSVTEYTAHDDSDSKGSKRKKEGYKIELQS